MGPAGGGRLRRAGRIIAAAIAPRTVALDIAAARSLFPLTQRFVFMNHAGVAPMSDRSRAAIDERTQQVERLRAEREGLLENLRAATDHAEVVRVAQAQ